MLKTLTENTMRLNSFLRKEFLWKKRVFNEIEYDAG
jgi:hypothetical protein